MNYENHGEIEIERCDEANVPVNSFLLPPDDECTQWRWIADNFMPRKARVASDQYEIRADSQEPLMEAVQKHVVPLYEAALDNLKTKGLPPSPPPGGQGIYCRVKQS